MAIFRKRNIFFFKGTKVKLWKIYSSFTKIPKKVFGKHGGEINLKKAKEPVEYDSLLEKKILLILDECTFIKEIKTQSLEITYKGKGGKKDRKYIPDIQLLQYGGAIIIVEVKPFKEMVNSTVLRKTKALRKYCEDNKYGHAVVDVIGNEFYTFEDLKKEKVSQEVQDKFIDFVAGKGEVTFTECKEFKKNNNIDDKKICYIIWNNNKKIEYKQHKIIFTKKKHM